MPDPTGQTQLSCSKHRVTDDAWRLHAVCFRTPCCHVHSVIIVSAKSHRDTERCEGARPCTAKVDGNPVARSKEAQRIRL